MTSVGRWSVGADKGLIITTGGFTRDARREATRDGATPIDLIDGELLVEKLKEFRLGIDVRMVESVEVREDWFKARRPRCEIELPDRRSQRTGFL